MLPRKERFNRTIEGFSTADYPRFSGSWMIESRFLDLGFLFLASTIPRRWIRCLANHLRLEFFKHCPYMFTSTVHFLFLHFSKFELPWHRIVTTINDLRIPSDVFAQLCCNRLAQTLHVVLIALFKHTLTNTFVDFEVLACDRVSIKTVSSLSSSPEQSESSELSCGASDRHITLTYHQPQRTSLLGMAQ